MGKLCFLVLFLFSCQKQNIEPKTEPKVSIKLFHSIISSPPVVSDWWLGGGLISESTDYVVYDPLIAADLAASYVNLANPGTNNATVGSAPTLSQGWVFNGSSNYLSSGVPAKVSQTVIAWIEGNNDFITGAYAFGATQSTPTRTLFYRPISSTAHEFQKGATKASLSPTYNGAVIAITENKAYGNGVYEQLLDGFPSDGTREMYLGCYNSNGTASNFCKCRILRFAIYNFSLSDAQVEAVTNAMLDYNVGTLNSYYSAKVLALNPTIYYPCNETVGTVLLDHSGNKYHGEAYGCTTGYEGLYGNAFKSAGTPLYTGRPNYKCIADQAVDDNELTFSCLVKPSGSASPQVRLYESHHTATANSPLGDYVAFELRNGNDLSFYLKEDGVAFASGTITLVDTEWHNIGCYNSLSAGVWGIWVDDDIYEFAKTSVVGVTATMTHRYPYLNDESDSPMQHIGLWDRKLSQAEILTLNK